MSENTAIIAGVVAALVLLVTLTLLAVYYINTHPTVAPPFYLMQVRNTPTDTQQCDCFPCVLPALPNLNMLVCLLFAGTHQ